MLNEEWRAVVGYERSYEVSSSGRMRSLLRSRRLIMSQKVTDSGHRSITLYAGDGLQGRKELLVHKLVLFAFVGPCPAKMESCHGDGDPSNNVLGNLRWDTRKGNAGDMIRHGRSLRGRRHPKVKLGPDDIPEIRKRLKAGESQRSIAAGFGVVQGTISSIHTGRNWSHIA